MGIGNEYARPEMLAETSWLATNLNRGDTLIVDTRSKEKYAAGHITGAVWFDAGTKLKDPEDKLHAPRPELFKRSMDAIGITPETNVVIYDEIGGSTSARFWWVLDYYGHTSARILNGGWVKWEKEDRPTDTAVPDITSGSFTPKINPETVCDLDGVEKAITDASFVILDVRTTAEYNGADVRAERGGHIPNAVNIDWQRNLTDGDPKVWKPAGELRDMFEGTGARSDKKIITYCQSAMRASHTLFTLRLLGYNQVSNYDGSWAEYGNRSDTKIAR